MTRPIHTERTRQAFLERLADLSPERRSLDSAVENGQYQTAHRTSVPTMQNTCRVVALQIRQGSWPTSRIHVDDLGGRGRCRPSTKCGRNLFPSPMQTGRFGRSIDIPPRRMRNHTTIRGARLAKPPPRISTGPEAAAPLDIHDMSRAALMRIGYSLGPSHRACPWFRVFVRQIHAAARGAPPGLDPTALRLGGSGDRAGRLALHRT